MCVTTYVATLWASLPHSITLFLLLLAMNFVTVAISTCCNLLTFLLATVRLAWQFKLYMIVSIIVNCRYQRWL